MAFDKESEIGALWLRQWRSGEFYSGKIGDQEVVIFPNTHKKPGERTPDFRVYRSEPRDGQQQPQRQQQQRATVTAEDLSDEIPW